MFKKKQSKGFGRGGNEEKAEDFSSSFLLFPLPPERIQGGALQQLLRRWFRNLLNIFPGPRGSFHFLRDSGGAHRGER